MGKALVPGSSRRAKRISDADRGPVYCLVSQGMTVRDAASAASHPPVSFYSLSNRDAEFRHPLETAKEIGTDVIERKTFRRAVEGWDEPVIGKVAPGIDGVLKDEEGNPVVTRKYSDRLLEVLLKGGRRPSYRDSHRLDLRQQTVNVSFEDRSAALAEVAEVFRQIGLTSDQVLLGGVVVSEDGR